MPLNDKWLKSGSPSVVNAGTEPSGAPFQDQTAEEITPQRMRNFSYEVNQELGKAVLRDPPLVAGAYVGNTAQPPPGGGGQNGPPWLRMVTPYSAGDTNSDVLQIYSINQFATQVKTTWFNGNGELRSAPSLQQRIAFRVFEHHEAGGASTQRFFEASTNPTNSANREPLLGVYGTSHATQPGWTVATRVLAGQMGVAAGGSYNGLTPFNLRGLKSDPGAPVSGTWVAGDVVLDNQARFHVCSVAGTPGTWVSAP